MEVDGRLTIGVGGKANANIKAAEVVVAGSAKGNIETMGRFVLRAGANLEGDVKAAAIVIEDGAYFKGGVDIARPPSS
jgi:cytoskeletal protein CcmA (bactofilin family)